jgi:hypothetical protein
VGNIGGEAARHLAMLGVPLLLIDRGVVEPANLGTQGFVAADLGLPKVDARRLALRRLNPDCHIDAQQLDIDIMGFASLRSADLWLCCLDSLRLRVRVNEMALRLSRLWIDAAIDGTGRSFARVTAYDARPDSPCFLCGYGQEGFQELMRQGTATPCLPPESAMPDAPPTHAVSAMGSLAASIQVLWAMRSGLELPGRLEHTEFLLNLNEPQCRSLRRSRDPRCVITHDRWPLTTGLHQGHTLDDAFQLAERFLGANILITLVHRRLVTELACGACGARSQPYRVLDSLTHDQLRCECGNPRAITATGWLDRMSRVEAADFLDRPLRQLGIPADDILLARGMIKGCFLLAYLHIAGAPEVTSNLPHSHQDPEKEEPHGPRV